MSWYYNVAAAQQAKSQAAANTPQPQQQNPASPTYTVTQPNGTVQVKQGSAPNPLGPDPQSTDDVVRTVAPTPQNPQGQVYVRSDYEVASKRVTPQDNGMVQTSYVLQPVKTVETPAAQAIDNNLFSGNRNSGPLNGQPILNTNEKRLIALETITAVVAPVMAPARLVGSIVTSEVIGAGLGQAGNIYNAAQGKEVTLEQYAKAGIEGAAVGAVFSVVGGKALQLVGGAIGGPVGDLVYGSTRLGAAGVPLSQQVVAVGVRTGVNAGLGAGFNAGVEFVQTGKVTSNSVISGAAYGAAFSAGGELIGMYGPKVTQAARSKIESAKSKIIDRQWTLNQLESADKTYMSAVSKGERFNPTFGQKVAMKISGVEPVKILNKDIRLMPTIETSPNAAFETGLEGTKIISENRSIKSMGQVGGEPFEGTIIMDKTAYQGYKNFMATEATDAATTFFGLSEPPTKPYSVGNESANSQQSHLGGNSKALPNGSKILKSYSLSKEAQIYNTNKNVDDYLANLDIELNNSPVKEKTPTILDIDHSTIKQASPNIFSEDVTVRPKNDAFEAKLQPEILTKKDNRTFADPARFEEAEKLLRKTSFSQSDLEVVQELNAVEAGNKNDVLRSGFDGYAAEPTGGTKIVTDIFSGRTVDTGRVAPFKSDVPYIKPFIGSSWSIKNKTISQTSINVDMSVELTIENNLEIKSNPSTRETSNSFWDNRQQNITSLNQKTRQVDLQDAFSLDLNLSPGVSITNIASNPMTYSKNILEAKSSPRTVQVTRETTDPLGQTKLSSLNFPISFTETAPTTTTITEPEPNYFSITAISQKSILSFPDEKLEAGGSVSSSQRKRGLTSRKKRYGILTGESFLDNQFKFSSNKKSEKLGTAFRATKGSAGIAEYKISGKALKIYSTQKRRK